MKTKIQLERVLCWHGFYGIKETIVYGIMREKQGSRVSKRYAHGMNGTLLTACEDLSGSLQNSNNNSRRAGHDLRTVGISVMLTQDFTMKLVKQVLVGGN
ncbi:hypothetical protein P8452_12197 [Trifolium repens]|jgi:hypothetical protein|nr:hypothetical protein P8452_12197 [Trifolium repens]